MQFAFSRLLCDVGKACIVSPVSLPLNFIMNARLTVPIVLWSLATAVLADGPIDNSPDQVRRVPPPGIAIADAERAELGADVEILGAQIEALRIELKERPSLLMLLPDAQIYHKAVHWALAYGELF